MRLLMVAEDGQIVAEAEADLTRSDYAVTSWNRDQLLKGKIQLATPAITPAGTYDLRLSVAPAAGGRPLPVNWGLSGWALDLVDVEIEAWPLETVFPPIENAYFATFGEPALFELHGYDLGNERLAPGASTPLTLYWRSTTDAPPVNYHVFVHVVQDGEPPAAQDDGPPLNGFRPTSSWRQGEVFVDERILHIPNDAVPGAYRLHVGLYDPDTGQRLPAIVNGAWVENDAILLQDVIIAP